ncbi:type II toxin-antitoxin system ParD family antitoxin [Hoeflea sp.]|uniref:type II toxin-antitoxin system ParD family antitoxin n=1 Tax=Hoeflea sp. TaxID=1940281 RepID=UPI0019963D69|nr:type II toxin-antitoxin system ParD family antitoxin [Hoeflea sp.]MBC7280898.1 type II toxin-antitoxin system ParD family antitoxin [Hoeflea sp.]
MASMNISLPAPMKGWVEEKANSGQYSNTSDYVRDLIRKDQERDARIARIQMLADEARASGVLTNSTQDNREGARRLASLDL